MSTSPPESPPPAQRPEGTIRCARCGADVPPGHDWCLECGLAARTRVATAPPWRVPLAAAAVVAALALAALAVAFVDLTEDPPPPVTTPQPAATAPPAPTQAPPPATAITPPATAPATTPTAPATTPAATAPTGGEQAP